MERQSVTSLQLAEKLQLKTLTPETGWTVLEKQYERIALHGEFYQSGKNGKDRHHRGS
jgi:hypothetical protein